MQIDAIHPGEHVQEELDAMQISVEAFASQLSVSPKRLSELVKGDRHLDADMALRLAHFFGTSAEFWLSLQNLYDLRKVEEVSGDLIKSLPTIKELQAA